MFKKKGILLTLLAAILMMALVACNAPEKDSTKKATDDNPKKEEKVVKLQALVGAGLAQPMDDLIAKYEEKTGVKIEVSYNNNAGLVGQMETTKQGDVFLPGSQRVIEKMQKAGHIDEKVVGPFAFHTPTILVKKGNPQNIQGIADLAKPGLTIAIPSKDATPLGQSAFEMFEKLGITADVNKNEIITAQTGSEAVMAIMSGEVDAAISELAAFQKNREKLDAVAIDPNLNVMHAFMGTVISYSKQKDEAEKFLQFLEKEAPDVFKYHGYNTKGEIHK